MSVAEKLAEAHGTASLERCVSMTWSAEWVLLALDREAARRVFGCRQSGEWESVVGELVGEQRGNPQRLFSRTAVDGPWRAWLDTHDLLRALIAPPQPLWTHPEFTLSLIRPDLVPLLLAAWDASAASLGDADSLTPARLVLQQAVDDRGALLAVIPVEVSGKLARNS